MKFLLGREKYVIFRLLKHIALRLEEGDLELLHFSVGWYIKYFLGVHFADNLG